MTGAIEDGAGDFAESELLGRVANRRSTTTGRGGNSEAVFTAEDAVGARDFSARQGAFSRECLVHFKKTQRGMAEKDPPRRRLRL